MNVRILHFSPSTATGRHDSHRACLLLALFLKEAAGMADAPLRLELVWALPSIESKAAAQALMQGADALVLASPTYAQGSPWFVRRFLELGAGLQLWGALGTAIATAGGQHTGGEVTVSDTLRSLQGMGMLTFTFAQKYVVFGAQQKAARDGQFELTDAWFLRQMARTVLAQCLGRGQGAAAASWARQFGLHTSYYNDFPAETALRPMLGDAVDRINAPLEAGLPAYSWWSRSLGLDATPPDARRLSFFHLLPEPGFPGSAEPR